MSTAHHAGAGAAHGVMAAADLSEAHVALACRGNWPTWVTLPCGFPLAPLPKGVSFYLETYARICCGSREDS